ncbi:MAG: hypothetical protein IJQ54_00005 [Kiritimatiellae bacterium]|nr:hypothetical protein [Kiritimatiellia bacterium]
MAKKLTVEVDAETTKAKRKIQELAETGGSSAGADASPAIDKAARALSGAAEKTSRSFGKLDEASQGMNRQMLSVTRAFAGMATGLAMSYASRYFAEGSTGRNAMEYGGAMLAGGSSGAMAGMAFGPVGAAIGAAGGAAIAAGKTYLDKEGEMESRLADFEKSERIFAGISAWQAKLRELSEQMNTEEIKTILANLKNTEQTFKSRAVEAIKGERYQEASDYQRNLGDVRQKQQQLEALLRKAEAEAKKPSTPEARASMDALDSLARVGGNFAGSDAGFRDLQRVNEKQVAILEKIEAKTGKGSGTF